MTQQTVVRNPGRPKDQAKRAAILAAANALFMERGYGGVTMEAVAAAARVSKMTVYGHFQDKAALFSAVVRANTDQMMAALTELDAEDGKHALEPTLVAIGTALLSLILSPRIVMMSHLLMGMLMKDRVLAESFYAAGPGYMRQSLADFLADAARRGEITLDSPQAAADDLLGLWESDMPKRVALGVMPPPTAADIDRHVRRGTRVFLRAYQAVSH